MASQDRQAERGEGGAGRRDSARCVDRCSAARHALYFCFPYLQMLSFRDQTSWVAETGTSWSGGWVPGIHSKPHTSWSSSTAAPRPTILHAFMLRRSGTFVAWMLAPVGNPPGRGRCMLASLRQTNQASSPSCPRSRKKRQLCSSECSTLAASIPERSACKVRSALQSLLSRSCLGAADVRGSHRLRW